MYYPSVQKSLLQTTPNLKNVKLKKKLPNITYFFRYSLMIRKFTVEDVYKNVYEVHHRMHHLLKNEAVCRLIEKGLKLFSLKQQSTNMLRLWARQCECVVAQRFRRTQQMFCLYSKLWEERALRELLNSMRRQFSRRGKDLLLGALGVSAYNWRENSVTTDELNKHNSDLDYVYMLKEKTFACDTCQRINVDPKKPNLTKCKCPDSTKKSFEDWVPYIEKDDLIVWRRTMADGNYEYKVYGSYDDVTAIDFLNVQIDAEYRKTWDSTAVVLNVVEKDPNKENHADIIYWEMQWPRLFANRDYVFYRRCVINPNQKTLVMYCRHTTHPSIPSYPNKHRVQAYKSVMVIKPYNKMDAPGLEFSLTYFDNPGVSIPSTVTSWVAMRAMPEFLTNLRDATKRYGQYCKSRGYVFKDGLTCTMPVSDVRHEEPVQVKGQEGGPVVSDSSDQSSVKPAANDVDVVDASAGEDQGDNEEVKEEKEDVDDGKPEPVGPELGPDDGVTPIGNNMHTGRDNKGYFKYLHPLYYFT